MPAYVADGPREAGKALVHRSIVVNGEPRATHAATLSELVAEAGYGDAKIATATNGDFVPARARGATQLADGDRVEIVAPRQGG